MNKVDQGCSAKWLKWCNASAVDVSAGDVGKLGRRRHTPQQAPDRCNLPNFLLLHSTTPIAAPCRWLALALEHPPWSPQQHARFPPSFRRAVATVLLAAHRGCFSSLPGELLQQILGLAAWPLSAWAPLDVPVLVAAPLGGACLPAE